MQPDMDVAAGVGGDGGRQLPLAPDGIRAQDHRRQGAMAMASA